jgi:IS4 transposase
VLVLTQDEYQYLAEVYLSKKKKVNILVNERKVVLDIDEFVPKNSVFVATVPEYKTNKMLQKIFNRYSIICHAQPN